MGELDPLLITRRGTQIQPKGLSLGDIDPAVREIPESELGTLQIGESRQWATNRGLRVTDEKVLDLSWALYNGALTELAFSAQGWGLVRFNGTPHLRDARLVTSV